MKCYQLTQNIVEQYMMNLIHVLQRDAPLFPTFTENDLTTILHGVQDLYAKESIMVEFNVPRNGLIVVGDLHGDMYCLLRILLDNGFPPHTNYLFLGDYVDRGRYQVQLIIFIFLMKLRWPNHVTTLKGNHEDYQCAKEYQFYDQCRHMFKKSTRLYTYINHVFDYMPVCAIISDHFFACHGGISQWLICRENVKYIPKPTYANEMHILENALLADLLWADPVVKQKRWFAASPRNCGYTFNKKALDAVLAALNVKTLIRGHQYYPGGTRRNFNDDSCFTVHSTTDEHKSHKPYSGTLKILKVNGKFQVNERSVLIPRKASAKPMAYGIEDTLYSAFTYNDITYDRVKCRWCEQPRPLHVTRNERLYIHDDIWNYMEHNGQLVLNADATFKEFCRRGLQSKAKKRALQLFPLAYEINFDMRNSFLISDCVATLRVCFSKEEYFLMEKIYDKIKRNQIVKLLYNNECTKEYAERTQTSKSEEYEKHKNQTKPFEAKMESRMPLPILLVAGSEKFLEEVNQMDHCLVKLVMYVSDSTGKNTNQKLFTWPKSALLFFDSTPFYLRAPGATFGARDRSMKLFDAHSGHLGTVASD